jgi:DMSO/TMAO reductase YedYZ molybdopterin-dependent catalytic subunit
MTPQEFSRRTRRSFLVGGAGALAGLFGWNWLRGRRPDYLIPWPLRRALQTNEQLWRDYSGARSAKLYDAAEARMPRENGAVGLDDPVDLAAWKLHVEGVEDGPLELTMDDIRALPKVEMTTQLRCIEGWSEIVQWGGARFADFAARYPPDENSPDLDVSLETPDGGYYVGLDLASALHPQTLLCYEMNGRPLEPAHGAPLRLAIPVKYGIKNIKRIGRIRFTTHLPADYWAERGYDWYAGL